MAQPRDARPHLDPMPASAPRRSSVVAALGLLFVLLAVSLAAGVACRGQDGPRGMGGQSGDEGRRPSSPWLGTGGVAAEPSPPR
jgi:hypothetical protein